jgi:hypothetical protein
VKTITKRPTAIDYSLRMTQAATAPRVDRERGIIYGAALIQLGDINDDRQVFADETTLTQTLSLSKGRVKGLKSRFTHPNMSNDGLGQFLGRWKNHRLSDDGQFVLADLHVSPIARKGENSRGEYTLDMAEQEPDMFGVSLAPSWDEEAMEKEKRNDGKQPLRFKSLTAADVVDEPAATRGGFFGDEPLSIASAPRKATQVLDSLFADADSEVIRERCLGFVDTYLANRFASQGTPGGPEMANSNEAASLTREDVQAIVKESLGTFDAKLDALSALIAKQPEKQEPDALAETKLAETTRCKELFALAQNSGLSDWQKLSTEWVDKNLSVIEAKAALGDLAIQQNKLTKDNGEGEPDTHAKFRAEFRAGKEEFAKFGIIDEDSYVRTRCRDEGLPVPEIKKAS